MMRVVVVDDEPLARNGVLARLAHHADIDVVAEYADGIAALTGFLDVRPDLVFIDIDMPGMSGLDVLAALDPHARPMAILLTAYDNFGMRAFALNVIDYLLKPIDDDRFNEALARARLARPYRVAGEGDSVPPVPLEYEKTLSVRIGSRIVLIDANEVERIEAEGDYAALHVGAKQYLMRESLQRMMQRLDPAHFVRVHRSTIVRLDLIAELRSLTNRDALLRLRDGTPVRASRTYIEPLILALQRVRGCVIS